MHHIDQNGRNFRDFHYCWPAKTQIPEIAVKIDNNSFKLILYLYLSSNAEHRVLVPGSEGKFTILQAFGGTRIPEKNNLPMSLQCLAIVKTRSNV